MHKNKKMKTSWGLSTKYNNKRIIITCTWNHFSKTTLLVLKVPMVSISITVLKALKESEAAGQRKFPAASVKIDQSQNC